MSLAAAAAASNGSAEDSSSVLVDEQLQRLLEDAGLESAPFDPSSLEALKRQVRERTEAGKPLMFQSSKPLPAVTATTTTTTTPVFATPITTPTIPPASSSSSGRIDDTGQAVMAPISNVLIPNSNITPTASIEEQEEEPPLPLVDIYGPTTPTTAAAADMTGDPRSTTNGNGDAPITTEPYDDKERKVQAETRSSPMFSQIQKLPQRLYRTTTSEMTDPGSSVRMGYNSSSMNSSANSVTKTEARILEQLQVQTALILQLQRRVDDLTATVKEQQQDKLQQEQSSPNVLGVGNNSLATTSSKTNQKSVSFDAFDKLANAVAMGSSSSSKGTPLPRETPESEAPAQAATAAAPEEETPAVAPQQPPPRAIAGRYLVHPIATIRNSRIAGLYRVFYKLRRQQVRNLPWGVILKVLMMMSILLGRVLSSSLSRKLSQDDSSSSSSSSIWSTIPFKFYVLVAVVFLGFFGQAGYFGFLYKFLIKERYPLRILVMGEDVDAILEELERPGPPPGPGNHNNPRPVSSRRWTRPGCTGWSTWKPELGTHVFVGRTHCAGGQCQQQHGQ